MARRWAWSVSHSEFTLLDHYYFSRLRELVQAEGIVLDVVASFDALMRYDGIIFNYPEEPFRSGEVDALMNHVARGAAVIALAYYENEDNVAALLNALLTPVGLAFGYDAVTDPVHNVDDDPYLLVTHRVHRFGTGVGRLVLPCPCSVRVLHPAAEVVVEAEETAVVSSQAPPVLAALRFWERGWWMAMGTCVFWDNFTLPRGDNARFALNLLKTDPA